mmetsp:Transcript_92461/g.261488  ORF Transcript_92461/g.261488 Transcript_92461/m.261488 type:complete len:217 (-) Transcript_92461:1984-2634(-)
MPMPVVLHPLALVRVAVLVREQAVSVPQTGFPLAVVRDWQVGHHSLSVGLPAQPVADVRRAWGGRRERGRAVLEVNGIAAPDPVDPHREIRERRARPLRRLADVLEEMHVACRPRFLHLRGDLVQHQVFAVLCLLSSLDLVLFLLPIEHLVLWLEYFHRRTKHALSILRRLLVPLDTFLRHFHTFILLGLEIPVRVALLDPQVCVNIVRLELSLEL